MNAANEVAVQAFLDGAIGFLDIAKIIEETLGKQHASHIESVEMLIETDKAARAIATELCAAAVS